MRLRMGQGPTNKGGTWNSESLRKNEAFVLGEMQATFLARQSVHIRALVSLAASTAAEFKMPPTSTTARRMHF